MNASPEAMVLVTGASGFIAMHCIRKLLEKDYLVRGTLRSPEREASLRETFARHAGKTDRLEFVTADLAAARVKRVVMTSSIAAITVGYDDDDTRVFSEDDWSRLDGDANAYQKSKTLAEQAAWNFIEDCKGKNALELAVINPGMVLGPILDPDYSPSGEIIRKLMRREFPGCPDLSWPMVDVRDVADAHLAAMTIPDAAGKRFCCAIENHTIQEIALILNREFGHQGYKVPTRRLPNFMLRIASLYDKTVRLVLKDLGKHQEVSNERIKAVLNWKPHSLEEMVLAMAESMVRHGVV